jgi:hypothetical protein
MMVNEPWPMRAARVLPPHGLSMPEYYLMCTAGYRVTIDRWKFVQHVAREFEEGGWPEVTRDELQAPGGSVTMASSTGQVMSTSRSEDTGCTGM